MGGIRLSALPAESGVCTNSVTVRIEQPELSTLFLIPDNFILYSNSRNPFRILSRSNNPATVDRTNQLRTHNNPATVAVGVAVGIVAGLLLGCWVVVSLSGCRFSCCEVVTSCNRNRCGCSLSANVAELLLSCATVELISSRNSATVAALQQPMKQPANRCRLRVAACEVVQFRELISSAVAKFSRYYNGLPLLIGQPNELASSQGCQRCAFQRLQRRTPNEFYNGCGVGQQFRISNPATCGVLTVQNVKSQLLKRTQHRNNSQSEKRKTITKTHCL